MWFFCIGPILLLLLVGLFGGRQWFAIGSGTLLCLVIGVIVFLLVGSSIGGWKGLFVGLLSGLIVAMVCSGITGYVVAKTT